MTSTLITGGSIATEEGLLRGGDLLIEGRKIRRIARRIPAKGARVVPARGRLVAPGLIDLQVNGAFGVSFVSANSGEVSSASRRLLEFGVTAYLPTLVSRPHEELRAAIGRVREAAADDGGARILGIHLEGPYLNAEKAGAHRKEFLRPPSLTELRDLLSAAGGTIRMVTLAPELPGALDLVREGDEGGVVMAAGHSGATADQIRAAAEAGLRHVTHVFNAMSGFHHRDETILNAALATDALSCSAIYDRYHLSPGTFRVLLRAKPPGKLALVSDAIAALGAPDGPVEVEGMKLVVEGGAVRDAESGRLTGGAKSILDGVRNAAEDFGLAADRALFLGSGAPAGILGIGRRKGVLRAGADADVILLDRKWTVRSVFVEGVLRLER
ncbi:MAG: N-acetylglucosamine-6-phosphate deacetylase [Planctomycetes bacterium]|nr:N-acetylglucosamine-6-phosphate deacetylase [Planctomycetota bacterium]